MRIMCAAHHWLTKKLYSRYPENIGCIVQPGKQGQFKLDIPWCCDNKMYSLWCQGRDFDEKATEDFIKLLNFTSEQKIKPSWVAVPDMPMDSQETSRRWKEWSPVVKGYGLKTAFVAQDGHTEKDIPENADIVFIGGSTLYKEWAMKQFCSRFPTHVGRISWNSIWFAHCAGAVSCDSSGWFRGDKKQLGILLHYLKCVNQDIDQPAFHHTDLIHQQLTLELQLTV